MPRSKETEEPRTRGKSILDCAGIFGILVQIYEGPETSEISLRGSDLGIGWWWSELWRLVMSLDQSWEWHLKGHAVEVSP